jgi:hypothetical protein
MLNDSHFATRCLTASDRNTPLATSKSQAWWSIKFFAHVLRVPPKEMRGIKEMKTSNRNKPLKFICDGTGFISFTSYISPLVPGDGPRVKVREILGSGSTADNASARLPTFVFPKVARMQAEYSSFAVNGRFPKDGLIDDGTPGLCNRVRLNCQLDPTGIDDWYSQRPIRISADEPSQ